MTVKKGTATVLMLSLCLFVSAFSVAAQGPAKDTLNIDKMIQTVGDKMAKAKPVIDASANQKAIDLFAKATQAYNTALDLNKSGKKMAAASKLMAADRMTSAALAMIQQVAKLDELLKKVADKIAKVEPDITASTNDLAKKIFASAKEHYAKAIELQKTGKSNEAMAQAMLADRMVDRAVEILNGPKPVDSTKMIDKMLEKLNARIQKATPEIQSSANAEAIAALAKAVDHYNKAVDLNKAGKIKEARAEAMASHMNLEKALMLIHKIKPDSTKQKLDSANLAKMLDKLNAKIQKVTPEIQNSAKAEAIAVLAKAVEHYSKAVELLKAGKIKEGRIEALTSNLLLEKAIRLIHQVKPDSTNQKLDSAHVAKMLDKLNDGIQKKTPDIQNSGKADAIAALAEAVDHYNKAVEFLKAGKVKEAKVEAITSRMLLAKALKLIK